MILKLQLLKDIHVPPSGQEISIVCYYRTTTYNYYGLLCMYWSIVIPSSLNHASLFPGLTSARRFKATLHRNSYFTVQNIEPCTWHTGPASRVLQLIQGLVAHSQSASIAMHQPLLWCVSLSRGDRTHRPRLYRHTSTQRETRWVYMWWHHSNYSTSTWTATTR